MKYRWHLIYRHEGKTYVYEQFETLDPNEARRNHASSCEFHWVKPEWSDPVVSPLDAVDERGSTRIREGCRPGQDPKRVYRPVPPPPEIREQLGLALEPDATMAETSSPAKGHPWDS